MHCTTLYDRNIKDGSDLNEDRNIDIFDMNADTTLDILETKCFNWHSLIILTFEFTFALSCHHIFNGEIGKLWTV